jgi:hypothetical protein
MDEEQLLDYEEEQDETQEQQTKNDIATNGDATKKIKVFGTRHIHMIIGNFKGQLCEYPQQRISRSHASP